MKTCNYLEFRIIESRGLSGSRSLKNVIEIKICKLKGEIIGNKCDFEENNELCPKYSG